MTDSNIERIRVELMDAYPECSAGNADVQGESAQKNRVRRPPLRGLT